MAAFEDKDYENINMMIAHQNDVHLNVLTAYFRQFRMQHVNIPEDVAHLCLQYCIIESSEATNIKNVADLTRMLDFERFYIPCISKFNKCHEALLKTVIIDWESKANSYYNINCRARVIRFVAECIMNDNVNVLNTVLELGGYNCTSLTKLTLMVVNGDCDEEIGIFNLNVEERQEEMMEFINLAATHKAQKCMLRLLDRPEELDWTQQLRPQALLNAIRENHDDVGFIDFVIDCFKVVGNEMDIKFNCDEVMQEIIRFDLVQNGQRIVENGWHKINDEDLKEAAWLKKNCNAWFNERDPFYGDYDNCEKVDLDDWGTSEDKEGFDEEYCAEYDSATSSCETDEWYDEEDYLST